MHGYTAMGNHSVTEVIVSSNLNVFFFFFRCGLNDSDKCECGETETCYHFLLRTMKDRENFSVRLFQPNSKE